MVKTISKKYLAFVHFIEVFIILLAIPLIYNFIPIDEGSAKTLHIDARSVDSVVNSLEVQGYTVTFIDKLMIQLDQVPKSGWYTLKKNNSRFSFFKNIYKHRSKTMNIVIFAGETKDDLIDRLANDTKLNRNKLYNNYKAMSLFNEADIFAGNYVIANEVSEKSLMLFLFSESKKIFDLFIEKTFHESPTFLEQKRLLTIASIIQKETNTIEEMSKISSVIRNRLKKGMKLQMDSTLNYGQYSHTIVTPERIKTDNSKYNTYKNIGLPPHPLSSVSVNALSAAMFPDKSDYLFFVLQPKGGHIFSDTYKKHLANIRTFRTHQKKKKYKLLNTQITLKNDQSINIIINAMNKSTMNSTSSIDKDIINIDLPIIVETEEINSSNFK